MLPAGFVTTESVNLSVIISIEATDYLLNTANSTIEAAGNLTINTREFYNVAAAAKLEITLFSGLVEILLQLT